MTSDPIQDALGATWQGGKEPEVEFLPAYAAVLAQGILSALPSWVLRTANEVFRAQTGRDNILVALNARPAGIQCVKDLTSPLYALLNETPPERLPRPLKLLDRMAVRYPTQVLRQLGVPPVRSEPVLGELLKDNEYEHEYEYEYEYDIGIVRFEQISEHLALPAAIWAYARTSQFMRAHGNRIPAEVQQHLTR